MYYFNSSNNPLGCTDAQLQLINSIDSDQRRLAEAMADLFDCFQRQGLIIDVWYQQKAKEKEGDYVLDKFTINRTNFLSKYWYQTNEAKRVQLAYLLVARMKQRKVGINDSDLFTNFYEQIQKLILPHENKFCFADYFRQNSVTQYEVENVIYRDAEQRAALLKTDDNDIKRLLGTYYAEHPQGQHIGGFFETTLITPKMIEGGVKMLLENLATALLGISPEVAQQRYKQQDVGSCINDLIDAARLWDMKEYGMVGDVINWARHERNTVEHQAVADNQIPTARRAMILIKFVVSMFTAAAVELKCEHEKYGIFVKSDLPKVTIETSGNVKSIQLGDPGFKRAIKVPAEGEYTLKATSTDGRIQTQKVQVTAGSYLSSCEEFNFNLEPTDKKEDASESEYNDNFENCIKDGCEAFARRDYKWAYLRFSDAYKFRKNSLSTAMMGITSYHLGKEAEARTILNTAISHSFSPNISPHAHFMLAYIMLQEGKQRYRNGEGDAVWKPVHTELDECKKYNTKNNECVKLVSADNLQQWFHKLPSCETLNDGISTILKDIKNFKKEQRKLEERQKLQNLIISKKKDAKRGERYCPYILAAVMAITMAVSWNWSDINILWKIAGGAFTALFSAFIINGFDNKEILGRPIADSIVEHDGRLCVEGLTYFRFHHIFILTLTWAVVPISISQLLTSWLELPNTYAVYAALRLVGKLMYPAAITIATLALINFCLRLYELLSWPTDESSFMARHLRFMLPPMRSDLPNFKNFFSDIATKMRGFVALALLTAIIWCFLTYFADKDLLSQKYHYWPFRPDAVENTEGSEEMENLTEEEKELQAILQEVNKQNSSGYSKGMAMKKLYIDGDNVVWIFSVDEKSGIPIKVLRKSQRSMKQEFMQMFKSMNKSFPSFMPAIVKAGKGIIIRFEGTTGDAINITYSHQELLKEFPERQKPKSSSPHRTAPSKKSTPPTPVAPLTQQPLPRQEEVIKHRDIQQMYLKEGSSIRCEIGKVYQLHLIVEPEDHDERIDKEWPKDANHNDIITVSHDYKITPLRTGQCLLVFTSNRTQKTTRIMVNVYQANGGF